MGSFPALVCCCLPAAAWASFSAIGRWQRISAEPVLPFQSDATVIQSETVRHKQNALLVLSKPLLFLEYVRSFEIIRNFI